MYMATSPATRRYVISAEEIRPGWALLYACTFALQLLSAFIRWLLASLALWVAFTILGKSTSPVSPLAIVVGFGPPALSFATLLLPLGGWLWRQQSGGRMPSERERLIYEDALEILAQAKPDLRPPRQWFVLDEPTINAAAYADSLMLTRGLLESPFLEPVLAHELGHLNSSDARLTAALRRLTTPPRQRLGFPVRTLGFLVTGGLGAWVMRTPWAAYWRSREFAADQYAAGLGQGEALARFLDSNALENDLPIPFAWLGRHAHPATEYRIDRLYTQEPGPDALAPGSASVKPAPAGPPVAGPDGPALTEPDPSAG
jgi:Zn-dependent protease with chaperone function